MAINNTILGEAQTIRDEVASGANTALRVGNCLVDIVNEFGNYMETADLGPALEASFASLDGSELVTWAQGRVVFLKSMGATYDGAGYTPVWQPYDIGYSSSGIIYYDGDGNSTIYAPKEGIIYVNLYTGKMYRWTGSTMTEVGASSAAGTITGITMNGSSMGNSGVVDLGTVITSLSGYAKYHLCADEAEYNGLGTYDSDTLYLIPE